ncbi:MAG: beta-xylosidase [Verrucomicrobiota bacterium]
MLQITCLIAALSIALTSASQTNLSPVQITVDASQPIGELKPIWRFFGADEPNYACMKDGQKLLGELGDIGREHGRTVYFRTHHLLTSGDGAYALKFGSTSAYKETTNGQPVYDWTINDKIFDAYLAHGIKPYVEIGFMPEALSTHPENYPHNPPKNQRAPVEGGQSYPPKDYVKWGNLCQAWAQHCVDRYGRPEVESWYWEVWNEPNIPYWQGSPADYCKLYDYAVDGVRRALPSARVGGPETAGGPGGSFLATFLRHCSSETNFATGAIGSPLDFIAFHAKGAPVFTNGHVRMGMANQLQNIDDACAVIAAFPEYRHLPVVIGESDPEGCAACRDPNDAYRNGTMYSSYTAASFPRKLEIAAKHGIRLEGALTWAFEFEDQPPFAGFRQLASAGIDLPVLNVFRMFGKMSGTQIAATSSAGLDAESIRRSNVREKPDVSAWASLDGNTVAVLVWHYHDDDLPGPEAAIDLQLSGLPFPDGTVKLTHYRVDADHSNAFEAWKKMGAPGHLTQEQYMQLEQAGRLTRLGPSPEIPVKGGSATLEFLLPRQGVSLLMLHQGSSTTR